VIRNLRPRKKPLTVAQLRRLRRRYRKRQLPPRGPGWVTIFDAERGVGEIPRNLLTEDEVAGAGGTTS